MLIIPTQQKRFFWAREIKFLNDLYKLFPNEKFWKLLKFKKKYDSLLFLKGDYGLKVLKHKFLEFSYEIPKSDKIILGEKKGSPYLSKKKPKTIKDFLEHE